MCSNKHGTTVRSKQLLVDSLVGKSCQLTYKCVAGHRLQCMKFTVFFGYLAAILIVKQSISAITSINLVNLYGIMIFDNKYCASCHRLHLNSFSFVLCAASTTVLTSHTLCGVGLDRLCFSSHINTHTRHYGTNNYFNWTHCVMFLLIIK